MRRLSPSPALLAYLDYELEGKVPPATQPPRQNRRALKRAAVAVVALAIALGGIGAVTLAFAQDACREPDVIECGGESAVEPELFSCCALAAIGPSDAPTPEPPDRPRPPGDTATFAGLTGPLGVSLLVLALGLVFAPDLARRWLARRRLRERSGRMAVDSRKGGRRSNEDRSAAFSVDEFDVMIVADGMGGHIGGARAASIAVETARDYLTRRLPIARDLDLVEDLIRSAFVRAAEALAAEDAEIGLRGHGVDALRTTLIVAVASSHAYVVGAQGDGGAWVQRATGISMPLMTPAKGDATNIVTASLGPSPEGSVEMTRKRRMPGDLLVVCTDGVADRVGPEFDEALRAYADEAVAAEEIVGPILDSFEERPAVFDDNVTLGVLVTP